MSQVYLDRMHIPGLLKAFIASVSVAGIFTACSDDIAPDRALVVSIHDYSYFAGDTVDYRVHNMSGNAVAFDTCSEPALQIRDTSSAWINVPPISPPPGEDEECLIPPVPIAPWKSLSFSYALPFSLREGDYRLVVRHGEPVVAEDELELPRYVAATPPFRVLVPETTQ